MSLLDKLKKPSLGQSLPGREEQMPVPPGHFVLGRPLQAFGGQSGNFGR